VLLQRRRQKACEDLCEKEKPLTFSFGAELQIQRNDRFLTPIYARNHQLNTLVEHEHHLRERVCKDIQITDKITVQLMRAK